jgi:nitroimidazol reductase NimA-like FMN-containing flavoprotein (pyridoxamine 5'-phosphate oxidase superfamily)
MCFLGVVVDGYPRVIPMVYGRIADTLYLHGSVANQALVAAKKGGEVCVTVTNVYGLVLANSLFHHSVNFHSAMIYGTGRLVTDADERLAALRAAAGQLVPGRAEALPDPSPEQLKATMVIALSLAEASVKVREGPPNGEPADYELDIWAGVVPLSQTWAEPEPDPKLRDGIPVPAHVSLLVGQAAAGLPNAGPADQVTSA